MNKLNSGESKMLEAFIQIILALISIIAIAVIYGFIKYGIFKKTVNHD